MSASESPIWLQGTGYRLSSIHCLCLSRLHLLHSSSFSPIRLTWFSVYEMCLSVVCVSVWLSRDERCWWTFIGRFSASQMSGTEWLCGRSTSTRKIQNMNWTRYQRHVELTIDQVQRHVELTIDITDILCWLLIRYHRHIELTVDITYILS